MNKKAIFLLLGLTTIAVIILFTITQWAEVPNTHKNGFNRQWINNKIHKIKETPTNEQLFNINGATKHNFFLSGKDARNLTVVSYDLTKHSNLSISTTWDEQILKGATILVDSPQINIISHNNPSILSLQIGKQDINIRKIATPLITRVIQISNSSLIFRGFDSSRQTQIFKKIDILSGEPIKQAKIIENQSDAGFSSDGTLSYDSITNRIIYIQYYQNNFYCLDTNLNVLNISKTIDTTNHNTVTTQRFVQKESGSLLPSSPLHPVNKESFASDGYLFVISSLQADNESDISFAENKVIDIYNIESNNYKGSFYIPNIKGKKARTAKVFQDILIAVYEGYIATFKLDLLK